MVRKENPSGTGVCVKPISDTNFAIEVTDKRFDDPTLIFVPLPSPSPDCYSEQTQFAITGVMEVCQHPIAVICRQPFELGHQPCPAFRVPIQRTAAEYVI